jgi:DNA-directed RNA polymerase subunit RPC12/RpoP
MMPAPVDLTAERAALHDEEDLDEEDEKPPKKKRHPKPASRHPRRAGIKVETKHSRAKRVEDTSDRIVSEALALRDLVNPRNIRGRDTVYCYRCATPIKKDMVQCPRCGSTDLYDVRAAQPTIEAPDDVRIFAPPWDMLPWPTQGSVSVTGPPGSGKSSLLALIEPSEWLTKEQDPKPVAAMFRRLGLKMPRIIRVETVEHVAEALSMVTRGPVVLDSLTAFGLIEALQIAHVLSAWSSENDNRVAAVLQVNKMGQSAGYMELQHLFDACVEIGADPFGVRAFHVWKSRWSPLGDRYWRFGKKGRIESPRFKGSYSVEGLPGSYHLHPFPMKGSKWAGLLAWADVGCVLHPGSASAAIRAHYMPNGFLDPEDVDERRLFAEEHGLVWLEPEEVMIEMAEKKTGNLTKKAPQPENPPDEEDDSEDLPDEEENDDD